MKPLKPSMRENKRYFLVKGKNLKFNIEDAILKFTGALGLSKTGIFFVQEKEDYAIISVNRESVNLVRASICIHPEKMSVEKVSGTLKSLGFSKKSKK